MAPNTHAFRIGGGERWSFPPGCAGGLGSGGGPCVTEERPRHPSPAGRGGSREVYSLRESLNCS